MAKTTTKRYFIEIDILRGIAIALVLLGHAIITFPINLNEIPWCGFLHRLVSTVHMPLFFAISGFCYRFTQWSDYLTKKAKRILVPYLVFCLIGVLPNILAPALVNKPLSLSEALLGILYGKSYWFLYVLMAIFLVFPFIEMFVEEHGTLVLGALFALYVIVPFGELWTKSPVLENFFRYLPFFGLGYVVRRNLDFVSAIYRAIVKPRAVLVLLLVLAAWLGFAALAIKNPLGFNSVFVRLLTATAGLFGCAFLVLVVAVHPNSALLQSVIPQGKYSLQIYLFQGYFLTLGRTLVVSVLGITNPIVIIAVNFVLMFYVSYYLIVFVADRSRLFRTLTGIV